MTRKELLAEKAPFNVRLIGKKRIVIVTGFAQNDPLGVGGGLFPDMPTAHFKNGGWLLVTDLIKNYEIVKATR